MGLVIHGYSPMQGSFFFWAQNYLIFHNFFSTSPIMLYLFGIARYSSRHFWIYGTILVRKIFKMSNFYFVEISSKMDRDHLLDLKKLQKTVFSHLWSILEQNWILKKKSLPNWQKMLKNTIFLKFRLRVHGRNRQEIGRFVAGRSA